MLGSNTLDLDNLPTSNDKPQLSLDLQDPILLPPPSHEAFTSHLDIPPDPTMDTKLPHSESITSELSDKMQGSQL